MLPRLFLELLRLFAVGLLSGTNLGRIASAAWDDGWGWMDSGMLRRLRDATTKEEALAIVALAWDLNHWGKSPSAEQLAKVGSSGAWTGHTQRDIFRAAESNGVINDLPGLYNFKAPGPGGQDRPHAMFLPHETVHKVV